MSRVVLAARGHARSALVRRFALVEDGGDRRRFRPCLSWPSSQWQLVTNGPSCVAQSGASLR